MVPLSAIRAFRAVETALAVNHQGQLPSVTLSFNLAPGVSLGEATTSSKGRERDRVAGTIHASFQGTAAAFQDSLANRAGSDHYRAGDGLHRLGILYESYIHPITILSTLPSAGVGALLALLITA